MRPAVHRVSVTPIAKRPAGPAGPLTRHAGQQRRRGVATLTVVMVLFFVMALVAAYTNRNLVFEQRISANGYRATRALEAADAGIEWTLAMLNGGRANGNCVMPAGAGAGAVSDFRSRYLTVSPDRTYGDDALDLAWWYDFMIAPYPACILANGVTRCVCPEAGRPPETMDAPADGVGSTFRVRFSTLHGDAERRPGTIVIAVRGCSNPGSGASACYAQDWLPPDVESSTTVTATLGLLRALPVAPRATLTAGGEVRVLPPGALRVSNGDFGSGVTVHAGGTVPPAGTNLYMGPAGSGADGVVADDASLAAISTPAAEAEQRWFRALFGMDRGSYQSQPAVVRLGCAPNCNRGHIEAALRRNPRNPIWVEGDLDLDAGVALGSVAEPMMLIVTGTLNVSGNGDVAGFAHANAVNWSAPGVTWDGALSTTTTFTTSTVATLRYSKPIMNTIQWLYGSFVQTPGSWNIQ